MDDVSKGGKPSAQIYRLTTVGPDRVLKDLGPNGGNNPGDAVQGNAFEPEDEFQQLYVGATRDQGIIQPPYVLRTLDRLSQENNALAPCIEAMVTNVDGTGYSFEAQEEEEADDEEDDAKIDALEEFFAQPWPGMSFSAIRRMVRRDLERTGNGFLEILRNAQDEIVFFRHVDAKMMRLLRLDDAVPLDVTVQRQGKPVTLTVMQRERRYCQLVNGVSLMYFKEFGSQRDLHKKTAVWAPKGQKLPAVMRATEIMHFTVIPDAHTPYGIPRWIAQLPSVLGSRKAEEFNLEFFDNGGVPPVMIMLQGGTLQAETRKAIQAMTTGEAKKNNRVQILEVEPTGGSLAQTPQARVTVERFGGDRTSDSMFEKYDERCEERVRRAFRMPPIFVGQSKDYNFACYDAETETLTDAGWIKYDGFKPGMKVACYDPATRALIYQEPAGGAQVYDVEDVEMHRFKGESLDLCVTPKHRMLWVTQHGTEKLAPIEEMLATCTRPNFVARIDEYQEGAVLGDFRPPWAPLASGANVAYDIRPRTIPATEFLQLVGWYISEGCAHQQLTEFSLCQKFSGYWSEILSVAHKLEGAGYTYRVSGTNDGVRYVHVVDKSLTTWLSRQAGFRSHEKRVPNFIKGLCGAQLRVFFTALMAGDGTWDARESRNSGAYSTTSKQLADDVQEVALKLGYRARLRVDPPGTAGIRAVYRVLLSMGARAGGAGRTQAVRYVAHHSRELYSGKVYCFSVPTGVFVTRRNGVIAVQGNTAFASYVVAEAQVFKPERDNFDEIITMRLLPDMGYEDYKLKSKPLVIEDATMKLQGVEIVAGMQQVEPADIVDAINKITGTSLKVSDAAPGLKDQLQPPMPPGTTHTMDAAGNITPINPMPGAGQGENGPKPPPGPGAAGQSPGKLAIPKVAPVLGGGSNPTTRPASGGGMSAQKSDAPTTGMELAHAMLKSLRKRDFAALSKSLDLFHSLDESAQARVTHATNELFFLDPSLDPQGLAQLSSCTLAVMAGHPHKH